MVPRTFGEWKPDVPDLQNDGLTIAKGCYPSAGGYAPFWDKVTTGLSVTGTVKGAARFERTDGTEVIAVGTTSDLFLIIGGVVYASSLGLSGLDADEHWRFEQFGLEVYATIKSGSSYYLTTIDSDTTFSTAPGSPPSGNALGRVDDFLIYGDLTDIDTSDAPYRIRWSPFNNAAGTWGTDIATQAGFVDMPGQYGPVKGISGGEVGIIFQKRGISRIDYVGGATAFQKTVISTSTGCESAASVADVKGMRYFLSNEGFARTNGADVEILSTSRVWDWFLETANTEQLHHVQAAINWDQRSVVWNFYQVDTTAYNGQIIYSWEQNRWSYALETVDWLVPVTYTGAFSEGDPRLRRILGGFVSGTHYQFSGDAIAAQFKTGTLELSPGQRSFVRSIRPVVEYVSTKPTVKVNYRDDPGTVETSTAAIALTVANFAPCNVDGRYFSVTIDHAAADVWDKAHGYVFDADPSGWT